MGEERDDIVVGNDDARIGPREGSASPYPPDVARSLSHLANLIDGSITLRGVGNGPREFAARYLGASPLELVATSQELGPLAVQLAGFAFAQTLERHRPVALIGEDMDEPPRYEQVKLGREYAAVPYELSAAFEAGTAASCAIVVTFEMDDYRDRSRVRVWSRAADTDEARRWLHAMVAFGKGEANPFRGRILRATIRDNQALWLEVDDVVPASRGDVVLDPAVWDEVNRSVFALFARLDVLAAAGLSTNRGILLAGPPGTGKTALCRAIATELAGDITVIFCDAAVVSAAVQPLYREIDTIAPALVVMEDLDLLVGRRRSGADRALNDFLQALDGAMTTHGGVVTIATTNDPSAIDAAATRAGRFDAVVRVNPPDADARAAILRRYLAPLGVDVDVRAIASATTGWTGAELRELVTRAVISTDRDGVSEDLLLRIARERPDAHGPGHYL